MIFAANGVDDGFAVTGSTTYSSNQNYLTDAGAYSLSRSYYGTFDQAAMSGNGTKVLLVLGAGLRGGSWHSTTPGDLSAITRNYDMPTAERPDVGFRVASIPGVRGNLGDLPVTERWTLRTISCGVEQWLNRRLQFMARALRPVGSWQRFINRNCVRA